MKSEELTQPIARMFYRGIVIALLILSYNKTFIWALPFGILIGLCSEAKFIIGSKKESRKPNTNITTYTLGMYIGHYIVDHYLPTLSTDVFCTRNTIQVSDEDVAELGRLNESWASKYTVSHVSSQNEWEELRKFQRKITVKYLPETITCSIPSLDMDFFNNCDMITLKRAIRVVLWNTDICSYAIENDSDIIIENSLLETKVTLTLDKKYD
jgi:hypothetical protein